MSPLQTLSLTLSSMYPESGATGYRIIGFGSILLSNVHRRFRKLPSPFRYSLNKIVQKSLSIEELSNLSLFCYQRGYWAGGEREGLFDWEQNWVDSLPAKSKILVTAAGDGREVVALEANGHDVWALEPAEKGFQVCRSRMKKETQAFQLSHEDLNNLVLHENKHPLQENTFDAVMVGWGSLTHCFGAHNRDQLFKSLKQLCPEGPMLTSFWGGPGETKKNIPLTFRLQNGLGQLVGGMLGKIRDLKEVEPLPIVMNGFLGPGIGFGKQELQRLASETQLTVSIDLDSPQPFAIFTHREPND